jgi:hypothetical protein
MRLYLLQIHKSGNDFDELYPFEDFSDLCAEFANKTNYYKHQGFDMTAIEEPTLDEYDNEVNGEFAFVSKDGKNTIRGRVCDLDYGDI